jgi:hypothetical protein
MDFPIPATVTPIETVIDPQVDYRERYSENDNIVLIKSGYAENAVYQVLTSREIENQFARLANFEGRISKYNNDKDNIKNVLTTALEDETIEQEVANDIARILGIDLSRSVNVTVSVEFELTITLPYGEDLDEVVRELSFDVSTGYGSDAEIESEDYSVNDWNESY